MAFKKFMTGKSETERNADGETQDLMTAAEPTQPTATFIDASTQIQGTVRCKETLRIDGQLTGALECEKTVMVREGAKVDADIAAETVQISGEVSGNITARRKITLDQTARVKGDLVTPGIVIEEGAKLQGQIVIGSEPESSNESRSKVAPDAKPAPATHMEEVLVSPLS